MPTKEPFCISKLILPSAENKFPFEPYTFLTLCAFSTVSIVFLPLRSLFGYFTLILNKILWAIVVFIKKSFIRQKNR
ncbi:hypothetical protein LMRF06_2643 [Listeria monocytogenes]|nr:hypothetical protein LMRF06_2643 [Listeria monocytogenes]